MMEYLDNVLNKLPYLMENKKWESMYIDYHPPKVERLWIQDGDNRIYLHKIHPCDSPMKHTHGWPSAIAIMSGAYEMRMGIISPHLFDKGLRVILSKDSMYEMLNPDEWHSVRPIDEPSLSVMVTGIPFGKNTFQETKKPENLRTLSNDEAKSLFKEFEQVLL